MSKQLVKDQFGVNAANYATSPVHAKGASLERLVELTGPGPDWVCLDVATAAGHTALAFAPHVARVVASDLTPEMIAEAQKLGGERGVTNMEFAIADAEALPFADKSFDAYTIAFGIRNVTNIDAALTHFPLTLFLSSSCGTGPKSPASNSTRRAGWKSKCCSKRSAPPDTR